MRLGILVSGNLGLLVLEFLYKEHSVEFVLTDKNSIGIKNFCTSHGIKFYSGNPRSGKAVSAIGNREIDLLISANYLFLIEEDLIQMPSKAAINIHGSLLPKYRGRTPHVWAIINNEKYVGITAHLIRTGCDDGEIIEQVIVNVEDDDTGYTVLQKYEALYIPLLDSVLQKIHNGNYQLIPQNHEKATFFPKRVPADGLINWHWQKERIRNWVRAQANPYPGAYSFCNEEKIVIDRVEFTDYGFFHSMPNGLIVNEDPLLVKVSNGVIRIAEIRNRTLFKKGDILK